MTKRSIREGGSASQEDDETVVNSDEQSASEGETSLESPERIARAKEALDKLVMETFAGHARPFQRKVEVFKSDPPTNRHADGGEDNTSGGWYERWVSEDRGDDGLQTIELRTFPDEENPDSAYKMSIGFALTEDGKPDLSSLMLSGEWPFDLAPLQGMATGAIDAPMAGVTPEGRRIQDFLYAEGAETLPVKEEDFSYVFSYRSLKPAKTYDAAGEQMDAIYKILKDAHVGGKDGPKVVELVPELGALVESKS